MSRFTRIFSGKFQYLGNCAGVKHLTNIMSATSYFPHPMASPPSSSSTLSVHLVISVTNQPKYVEAEKTFSRSWMLCCYGKG